MSNVFAINEISGVVALVPKRFLTHPVLGKNLREVRSGKTRGRLSEIIKSDVPVEVISSEAPAEDITEEDEADPSPSNLTSRKKKEN